MTSTDQPAPAARRGGRVWRVARRLGLGLLLLAAAVLAAGQIARARLRSRYPAPGRLIDIGGYRLHINCVGGGGPAVILESGLGEFSTAWAAVQPALAQEARVCAYDRGGYGWSDRSPRPRTAEDSVAELRALLKAAGIAPPYVLVGHSLGGLHVRLYAQQHPEEVAGLILVDPAHEDQNDLLPPEYQQALARELASGQDLIDAIKPLIGGGLIALRPSMMGASQKLPPEARAATNAVMARDSASLETGLAELQALPTTNAQLRANRATMLGALPLIVLTRGEADPPPGAAIDPQVIARAEALAHQQQAQVVGLSTRGRQIVVEGSGHHIQLDKPAAVIDAIRQVIAESR